MKIEGKTRLLWQWLLFLTALLPCFLYAQKKSPAPKAPPEPHWFLQDALPFSEGLAAVKAHDQWGYADTAGILKIDFKYPEVRSFSEGQAAVRIKKFWGHIDTLGNRRIAIRYHNVSDRQNGYTTLCYLDTCVLTDTTGRDYMRFNEMRPPCGHMLPVRSGTHWGIINIKTGDTPRSFRNDLIMSFAEGNAAFLREGLWGYFTCGGFELVDPMFEDAGPFSEGFAPVKSEGVWGYIDHKGKPRIRPHYTFAGPFSEGLAAAMMGDWGKGVWGLIDTNGTWVLEPKFRFLANYGSGLAPAESDDGKWGYVDRKGKWVIEPQYLAAQPFKNNRAAVKIGEYWGYIDPKGKLVIY